MVTARPAVALALGVLAGAEFGVRAGAGLGVGLGGLAQALDLLAGQARVFRRRRSAFFLQSWRCQAWPHVAQRTRRPSLPMEESSAKYRVSQDGQTRIIALSESQDRLI